MQITALGLFDVLILVLALAMLGYVIYLRARAKKLSWLFGIRIFVLLLLVFLLLQPVWVSFNRKSKPNLAVLVDTSSSMRYGGRFNTVIKFIKQNLPLLEKYFTVDIYRFSPNLEPVAQKEISEMKPNGITTDISNSVKQLLNSFGQNIDAVLLISDGQNNAGPDVAEALKSADIPVFTVHPSADKQITDISIIDVRCSDFAFKSLPVELTAVFYAYGLKDRNIKIYLEKDKEIISSKETIANESYNEVIMSFIPKELGIHNYTIKIMPVEGETVILNNNREFTIETVRDKLRILYICGQPNPEYYYLRNLIKSEPSMELVSFVILRNPENIAIVSDDQLSLIPFPTDTVFTKDLFDYDVLILENFNYAKFYIMSQHLVNINRFVKERGGGLLMIAGENAFGKGNYRGTALEEIIPVNMDKPEEPLEEGFFNARLVNYSHPIVLLADSVKESTKIWDEFPPVDGCQKLREKPGSVTIAVHPWKNHVCIACGEYGKGRSVAMGINTTWRWLLGMAQKGKSGIYYRKFWKNVLNWVGHIEESGNFRISVAQKNYIPGNQINVDLIVMDKSLKFYKPYLSITEPDMKIKQINVLSVIPDGWNVKFTPSLPGKYILKAWLEKPGSNIVAEDKKVVFIKKTVSSEDFNLQVNRPLMEKIAGITNADSFTLTDFSIDRINSRVKIKTVSGIKRQVNLWTLPVFCFIMIGLLLAEWLIKRIGDAT